MLIQFKIMKLRIKKQKLEELKNEIKKKNSESKKQRKYIPQSKLKKMTTKEQLAYSKALKKDRLRSTGLVLEALNEGASKAAQVRVRS
jgi:hypothetical protein